MVGHNMVQIQPLPHENYPANSRSLHLELDNPNSLCTSVRTLVTYVRAL